MSKFSDYVQKNGVATRRLLSVSHKLETHTSQDKAIKLAKRRVKEGAAKTDEAGKKPRSGRPINPRLLADAMEGKTIPAAAKTRFVRAINHILGAKKKGEATMKDLF